MISSKQIVVFDFDGVLCNSVHDSLMTAINTYIACVPDHTLPIEKPLTGESLPFFENEHSDFVKTFKELMPLGNFAQDYLVFLMLIEKGKVHHIKSQEMFNSFRESLPEDQLIHYSDMFYQYRRRKQNSNPREWARLLPPFDGIVDGVKKLSQNTICAIATSKDIQSVNILLKNWQILDCFDPDNILDKDFAPSKRDHLIKFHDTHHIPFERIHFIDDKVSHLLKVKDLNIKGYLATWGYNTEREYRIAQEAGFILLKLFDLPTLGQM